MFACEENCKAYEVQHVKKEVKHVRKAVKHVRKAVKPFVKTPQSHPFGKRFLLF